MIKPGLTISELTFLNVSQITFLFRFFKVQLDSAIFHNCESMSKEFVARDEWNRMSCVYHEIDRCLEKLIRGDYIRLVGSFNPATDIFTCFSARKASNKEIFSRKSNIDATNAFIKAKYC